MENGQIVAIDIVDMSNEGKGIGKIDGLAIFVDGVVIGDKISADKKAPIEAALEKLKEAHKSQDVAAIDAAMTEMNTAWTAASEEMYKATQEAGAQPGADAGASTEGTPKNDNVEDAQFEEVK